MTSTARLQDAEGILALKLSDAVTIRSDEEWNIALEVSASDPDRFLISFMDQPDVIKKILQHLNKIKLVIQRLK